MTQVGLLTQEQADQLMGVEFATDNFFNPIIDKNNNQIIQKNNQNHYLVLKKINQHQVHKY
jgi:hypothetical protein